MIIKGCKTVEEFKQEENKRINAWIDNNFVRGSVEWKRINAFEIEITDKTGDKMTVKLTEIN